MTLKVFLSATHKIFIKRSKCLILWWREHGGKNLLHIFPLPCSKPAEYKSHTEAAEESGYHLGQVLKVNINSGQVISRVLIGTLHTLWWKWYFSSRNFLPETRNPRLNRRKTSDPNWGVLYKTRDHCSSKPSRPSKTREVCKTVTV